MSLRSGVPEPAAIIPLTLFDNTTPSVLCFGWVVEGLLDEGAIRSALERVVAKWPLLAGRLELLENKRQKNPLQVRIPIGPIPDDYATFHFTATTSTLPLSHYLPIPVPRIHTSLPMMLFRDPSIPGLVEEFAPKLHPITSWHLTYFPDPSTPYTCIGVSLPHSIFDGTGSSWIFKALQAELNGVPWTIPAPPTLHPGINENPLQKYLDGYEKEKTAASDGTQKGKADFKGMYIVQSGWALFVWLWWHLWQWLWHGIEAKTLLLPSDVCAKLVDQVKKDGKESGDVVELTTGDVIAAWLFKTIYTDGTKPTTKVHCTNVGSYRHFHPSLSNYPHNTFLTIPYDVFTVSKLIHTPIHKIASHFARVRQSRTSSQVVEAYQMMSNALFDTSKRVPIAYFYRHSECDENVLISNRTVFKVAELDWRGAGGGRTLCAYRETHRPQPLVHLSGMVGILGWMKGLYGQDGAQDPRGGNLVIAATLNKKRWRKIEEAVAGLMKN
ncbi:hypothetical protein AX16_001210 [Volvariella volvacea WC 439]|nr:hypothetical protein AX16_001210 [Volvariella volvacea WC 439]